VSESLPEWCPKLLRNHCPKPPELPHNIDNFQREYLIDFLNYSQIIGDLNNDGVVNNSDFLMLLSFVIGGNDSVSAADINFDSEVDIFDLLLLSDFLQNM